MNTRLKAFMALHAIALIAVGPVLLFFFQPTDLAWVVADLLVFCFGAHVITSAIIHKLPELKHVASTLELKTRNNILFWGAIAMVAPLAASQHLLGTITVSTAALLAGLFSSFLYRKVREELRPSP